MNIISITTLDIPELEPYRTLRRPVDHHRQGIFIAESEKVVRRLLESRLEVLSALVTPEWLGVYTPLLEQRDVAVYVAPKQLLETIVGLPLHQGIMAVGRVPQAHKLDTILPALAQPYFLAAVDGLANAENIGVLVRNCVAFGVQALIVGETSSSPYLRRAVRNSMGTVFQLPVVHAVNLAETIAELGNKFAIRTIAAHPGATTALGSSEIPGRSCCVVFGSEGKGISAPVLKACQETRSVPMDNGVDSLNVGSASAVFLYAVSRQRRWPRME